MGADIFDSKRAEQGKKGTVKNHSSDMASSLRLGVGLLGIVVLMLSMKTVESECFISDCSIYAYGCDEGYTRSVIACYAGEGRMGTSGLKTANSKYFRRMYGTKCCKKSVFLPPYRRKLRDGEVEPLKGQ